MNTEQDYSKLKQIIEMQDEIIKRYDNIIIPGYEKKIAELEESKKELQNDLDCATEVSRLQEIEHNTFRKFHEDSYNKYTEMEKLKIAYEKLKLVNEKAQQLIESDREYIDDLKKEIQTLKWEYDSLRSDHSRALSIISGY